MSDPLNRKDPAPRATFLLIGAIVVLLIVAGVIAFLTMGSPAESLPPEQKLTRAAAPPPLLPSTANAGPPPVFGNDMPPTAGNAPAQPAPAAAPPPTDIAAATPPAATSPVTAPPAASSPAAASPAASQAGTDTPSDWTTVPLDEVRQRANRKELAAMEEMARRLIGGVGVAKDQQAGAGWLLRAAEAGSAQAAFNVGVMYERGFVVERDSSKAADWYRKAAKDGVAMAQHNLALLLRDGKGVPRNGQEAIELLRTAAHQGMAASMFSLGDIYERGDAAPKDLPVALAWYAVTAEFERQVNHGTDTTLGQTALERVQILQRSLTPAELERAQKVGQAEFHDIVEALSPTKPPAASDSKSQAATAPSSGPVISDQLLEWPKDKTAQVRAIQQALLDLKLLRDPPDGTAGPVTKAAIRAFERRSGLVETGEPTKDVYAALKQALIVRDVTTHSPLPPPPRTDSTTTEITNPTAPKPAAPAKVELPQIDLPGVAPVKTDAPKNAAAPAPVSIDLGKPLAPPPPPTSGEVARGAAAPADKVAPAKSAPPAKDSDTH